MCFDFLTTKTKMTGTVTVVSARDVAPTKLELQKRLCLLPGGESAVPEDNTVLDFLLGTDPMAFHPDPSPPESNFFVEYFVGGSGHFHDKFSNLNQERVKMLLAVGKLGTEMSKFLTAEHMEAENERNRKFFSAQALGPSLDAMAKLFRWDFRTSHESGGASEEPFPTLSGEDLEGVLALACRVFQNPLEKHCDESEAFDETHILASPRVRQAASKICLAVAQYILLSEVTEASTPTPMQRHKLLRNSGSTALFRVSADRLLYVFCHRGRIHACPLEHSPVHALPVCALRLFGAAPLKHAYYLYGSRLRVEGAEDCDLQVLEGAYLQVNWIMRSHV